MTAPKLTKRRTKLERKKGDVIGLMIQGESDAAIARIFGVARVSVHHFAQRHRDEIEAARAEVTRQLTDYAIAQKVHRIADAQWRRDLLVQVREARAKGGTGMETGIVARQYKSIGGGENAQVVEEYKVDTGFLAEWRANDHQVAEELAQLPRAPDANINVNVGLIVGLSWSDGEPA